MRSRIALHLVDPDAHRPRESQGGDAHVVELLDRLGGGQPRLLSRELSAIYYAPEARSEALAHAFADRLWLRPRLLLPARMTAAHWGGALDCLGWQSGGAIVVAPHATIAAAVTTLVQLKRARELPEPAAGTRQLVLESSDLGELERSSLD
jgi:hypothetical protein